MSPTGYFEVRRSIHILLHQHHHQDDDQCQDCSAGSEILKHLQRKKKEEKEEVIIPHLALSKRVWEHVSRTPVCRDPSCRVCKILPTHVREERLSTRYECGVLSDIPLLPTSFVMKLTEFGGLKATCAALRDVFRTTAKGMTAVGINKDSWDICRVVSCAERLTRLTRLDIEYLEGNGWTSNNAPQDLSPLESLTGLRELSITGALLASARPLSALTRLRKLRLTRVDDFSTLSTLTTSLRELTLDIYWTVERGDSSEELDGKICHHISHLTGLEELHVEMNLWNIDSLTKLTGLKSMELALAFESTSASFAPLGKMTWLRSLELHHSFPSDPMPALANLTALSRLHFTNMDACDMSPLSSLTNLQYLCLSTEADCNQIFPAESFFELSTLTRLEKITIEEFILDDAPDDTMVKRMMTTLASLKNLREICMMIETRHVIDISPLSVLTSLSKLKLSYCRVKGVERIPGGVEMSVDVETVVVDS